MDMFRVEAQISSPLSCQIGRCVGIKTILHINDNITLKRVYFSDFALKSALSLHKDPKATIANMVFCELLKLKKEIKYSNQIDFIVPDMSYGILILPFLPSELAILKAKKLSNHCNELGLKRVDIHTILPDRPYRIGKDLLSPIHRRQARS